MDKKQIEKRLSATNRQISLFEECIETAQKTKKHYDPVIYKAMIEGYEGERDRLKEEARQYKEALKP